MPPAASISEDEEDDVTISLEGCLRILRRHWYIIALFALLGGGLANYYVRQQNLSYERKASIILRDEKSSKDAAGSKIMMELGMGANTANIANEMHVLRSSPIMRQVVEGLKLNTSYWTQNDLHQEELYKETPLLVDFEWMDYGHVRFSNEGDERPWYKKICSGLDRGITITPKGGDNVLITYLSSLGEPVRVEGVYGQPVRLPFATFVVHPTEFMGAAWLEREIIVRHTSEEAMTKSLLQDSLSIERAEEKDASLLNLTFRSCNARKSEEALNLLIEVYNQMSVEEKKNTAQRTKAFLEERIAEIDGNLTKADFELTEFKKKNDLAYDAENVIGVDFLTAKELEKEIFEQKTQMKLAATLAEEVEKSGPDSGLIALDFELADKGLTAQISSYNEAYLEYRKLVSSAGSRNPLVVSLREQMASTRASIIKSLASYRNNLDIKHQELNAQLADMQSRLAETASKGQEIIPLMREHKVLEELYLLLLSKEQENALSLVAAEPRARVLEKAYGSNYPVAPRKMIYTAAGVVGGALFALLAIATIGMLDTKVKTKHDLEAYSAIPTIAELPQLTRKERKEGIFEHGAHSIMAECLHILRNNVENLLPRKAEEGTLILMTSTTPGEGKTFVSSNLSVAYAKAGRRVLLIDGDLRKGTLSRGLVGKGLRGLSTLLLRHASKPQEVIRPLPGSREAGVVVDLLASGPLPPNPVTLLTQPLFREVMDELRRLYDVIILDAPPYGIIADTDIMAQTADLSLYVVRSGRIDKRYFTQVQRLANQGRLPNPGFVLNDVNFRASSSGHYGYGYGNYHYHYGSEGSKTTEDITED